MGMAGFGAALGSFGEGMMAGENFKAKRLENHLKQEDERGKALWLDTLNADDTDGPAGPAGQVGQPAPQIPQGAPPQASPAPMPQAQAPPSAPMPQGGPPPGVPQQAPMVGAQPGTQPMAQGAPPPGVPQQAPMVDARPVAPPPQAGPSQPAAGPPPQGGQGGPPDLMAQFNQIKVQARQELRRQAQAIRKVHPNATPGEIAAALAYGAEQDKGSDPAQKLLLQSQIAELRAQTAHYTDDKHLQGTEDQVAGRSADTAARGRILQVIQGMKGLTEIQKAQIMAAAGEQEADTRAGAEVQAAGIRAESGGKSGGLMGDLKLEKALEGTQVGKDYARAKSAGGEIEALANEPDIYGNATAQLGMINRFLFMTTGSTRPPLAEYKKILGAQTGQDMYDMVSGRIQAHPILGRDQIQKILNASRVTVQSAEQRAMGDPTASRVIKQLNAAGSGGGGGGGGASIPPQVIDALKKIPAGSVAHFKNGRSFMMKDGEPLEVQGSQ